MTRERNIDLTARMATLGCYENGDRRWRTGRWERVQELLQQQNKYADDLYVTTEWKRWKVPKAPEFAIENGHHLYMYIDDIMNTCDQI